MSLNKSCFFVQDPVFGMFAGFVTRNGFHQGKAIDSPHDRIRDFRVQWQRFSGKREMGTEQFLFVFYISRNQKLAYRMMKLDKYRRDLCRADPA